MEDMSVEKKTELLTNLAVSLRVIGLQVTQEDCVMILNIIDAVKENQDIKLKELYDVVEKSKEEVRALHKSLV